MLESENLYRMSISENVPRVCNKSAISNAEKLLMLEYIYFIFFFLFFFKYSEPKMKTMQYI